MTDRETKSAGDRSAGARGRSGVGGRVGRTTSHHRTKERSPRAAVGVAHCSPARYHQSVICDVSGMSPKAPMDWS